MSKRSSASILSPIVCRDGISGSAKYRRLFGKLKEPTFGDARLEMLEQMKVDCWTSVWQPRWKSIDRLRGRAALSSTERVIRPAAGVSHGQDDQLICRNLEHDVVRKPPQSAAAYVPLRAIRFQTGKRRGRCNHAPYPRVRTHRETARPTHPAAARTTRQLRPDPLRLDQSHGISRRSPLL
jgi:hypothetical protein